MPLKQRAIRLVDSLVCLIRKVWRPFTLVGIGVGTWVNLVVIPLVKWEVPNLAEAAAWIAAVGGLSWIREWGKVRGVTDE